jgi:hypothetical protein
MRFVIRAYDALLYTMAFIAALSLVWLMVSVVLSVAMRNFGVQPFAWLFTSAEYGLLYMTMLGAPWLVRERGMCISNWSPPPCPRRCGARSAGRGARLRGGVADAGMVRAGAVPDEYRAQRLSTCAPISIRAGC